MASITLTPTKHWLLYPLLIGAVLGAFWLWRDTANKDAALMAQLVKEAKTSQAVVDKQALDADDTAQTKLKTQNATLQKQLAAAKTEAQQLAIINQQNGTNIPVPVHQDNVPDAPVVISPLDITKLAIKGTECAEEKNQVAADQVQIAGDKVQIEARDKSISAYEADVKALKGGSHLKRFLKAAKYIGIGAATGVITGIIIEKKHGF